MCNPSCGFKISHAFSLLSRHFQLFQPFYSTWSKHIKYFFFSCIWETFMVLFKDETQKISAWSPKNWIVIIGILFMCSMVREQTWKTWFNQCWFSYLDLDLWRGWYCHTKQCRFFVYAIRLPKLCFTPPNWRILVMEEPLTPLSVKNEEDGRMTGVSYTNLSAWVGHLHWTLSDSREEGVCPVWVVLLHPYSS